ncbi:MAG: ankyrin repeat domain-containing protein [Gemmatimonadetes bacterium]|nr:ankyrin repeat domain-containing protein [Gemmatimonadota bacterium]
MARRWPTRCSRSYTSSVSTTWGASGTARENSRSARAEPPPRLPRVSANPMPNRLTTRTARGAMAAGLRANVIGALVVTVLLLGSAVPDAPIADAAQRGDAGAVRELLKAGADVNAAQGDGMMALHWAAQNADVELTRMLIYAGANHEALTRIGHYTPLHLAARVGSGPVVRVLLAAGARSDAVTTTGGSTPLHLAAAAGSADAITALLESGAQMNARESVRGQTPLMFAAAFNRVEAINALLGGGADPALTTTTVDIVARERADDAEQRGEASPAPVAGGAGQPQEGPLSYGQLVGGHGGLTALLHAARQGHVEGVQALLDGGADINQASSGDHTSPLLIATMNGHFDLAMTLLARRADPNLASDAGAAPLFITINQQWAPKTEYPQQLAHQQSQITYLELMQALLKAGADPNARLTKHLWYISFNRDYLSVDTQGATPFWRAAYATDIDAMRLLVAHGADQDIPTTKPAERRRFASSGEQVRADPSGLAPVPMGGPGVYPIHAASGVGYGEGYAGNSHRHVPDGWVPAVRYLVEELHADVNARDMNGYSALHNAASRGDTELIRYLVGKGADPHVVSRRGQTTADMANSPVQRVPPFPEAVALLESLGSRNNHNCQSC